jgi:hypothetical protein
MADYLLDCVTFWTAPAAIMAFLVSFSANCFAKWLNVCEPPCELRLSEFLELRLELSVGFFGLVFVNLELLEKVPE